MELPDKQMRSSWREEISLFLGNIFINALLIIGVILVCIWFPFSWAFKKCGAWLNRLSTNKTKHMLLFSCLMLTACTCPEEVRTWAFPSMVECLKGVRLDSGAGIASITTETSTEIAGELTNGAIFSCTEVPVPGAAPRYQAFYSAVMSDPFSSPVVGPGRRGMATTAVIHPGPPRRAGGLSM